MAEQAQLIVMTPDQLRELIREEIARVLEVRAVNQQYLTLDQTSAMLQADPKTVKAWVRDQGLPALRAGREYRFRRDSVLEWLEAQAVRDGAHVSKHASRIKAVRGK